MAKKSFQERRSAIRTKRILSIQYRLHGEKAKNEAWHLSTTHDMSVSGISFLSEVAFNVDDILELQVVMSGVLDIFKGYSKVIRVEKKSTGSYYLIAIKLMEEASSKSKKG